MIPAKEARNISENSELNEINTKLRQIDIKIREACKAGETSINPGFVISPTYDIKLIEKLESLGYGVKTTSDPRNETWTIISW